MKKARSFCGNPKKNKVKNLNSKICPRIYLFYKNKIYMP